MKTLIRLHQVLLVLAILSGCYSPELRDCTVSCSGSDDCAGEQTCAKGFCAAKGVSCTGAMVNDAGTDARPVDAAPQIVLHVMISGMGKVDVAGVGRCGDAGEHDCFFSVMRGTLTATAIPTQTDHPFEKWESMTCMGQPATCTFMANGPTTIDAKFK